MSDQALKSELPTAADMAREVERPYRDKEAEVAELLTGQQPTEAGQEMDQQPGESLDPTQPDPVEPVEILDVKQAAEKLGLDPAKLYELQVPLADGESVTLGQLKDQAQQYRALDTERQQFVRERGEWMADRLQAERELDALLQAAPDQLFSPQLRELAERQRAELQARERERLLRAIPEWSDGATASAEVARIEALAARYGFAPAEVRGALDHRLFVMLRDLSRLDQAARQVKPKPPARPGMKPTAGRSGPAEPNHKTLVDAARSGRISKVAAVEQLLKG
jgi:hypothetical protein